MRVVCSWIFKNLDNRRLDNRGSTVYFLSSDRIYLSVERVSEVTLVFCKPEQKIEMCNLHVNLD